MITLAIDTSRCNNMLAGLREAMIGKGMDASHIVEDEVKQLSRTIVNRVPPLGPGGRAGGAKQAGENAIKREIKNFASEAEPKFLTMVSERWGLTDVKGYVEGKDKAPLQINFANVDLQGGRLPDLHERYRHNGKIPLVRQPKGIWNARALVPEGTRDPFIATLLSRVGIWKATWAYAGFKAGSRFPGWISRHFGSLGTLAIADLEHLRDPVKPYAIMGSRFPGNFRITRQVSSAVRLRVKVVARKIQLILADYKADMARGMRAEAAARRRREPEEGIE